MKVREFIEELQHLRKDLGSKWASKAEVILWCASETMELVAKPVAITANGKFFNFAVHAE